MPKSSVSAKPEKTYILAAENSGRPVLHTPKSVSILNTEHSPRIILPGEKGVADTVIYLIWYTDHSESKNQPQNQLVGTYRFARSEKWGYAINRLDLRKSPDPALMPEWMRKIAMLLDNTGRRSIVLLWDAN